MAILGAGTAGLGALREVRKVTESFVVVNDGPWGTMCAWVGCMPSKALIEAAGALHRSRALSEFGISGAEELRVSRSAVLARVRRVRDAFVAETLQLTSDLGERAVSGRGRLRGPNRIVVDGDEMAADQIILATGSRPIVPEKWRSLGDRLLTTDTLFEAPSLPERIAVLGLGPVGVELAQALARLGCEVAAFESEKILAGLNDEAVHACLLDVLRADLRVSLGHEVELSAAAGGVRVQAGPESVVTPAVLLALGRRRNLDGLGLETLGVKLDSHGLPEVDPATMQIGKLPVFLAGDAVGDRPIQHEASDEGHIAGRNAVGGSVRRYERRVPLGIVFTHPSVAWVGARLARLDREQVVIGEESFADQGRARLGLRGGGKLRVYAERTSGALLGAELCAPDGEHLAHFLALAIERGCTVRELLRAPIYHPSLEEGLRGAVREAAKQLAGGDAFDLEP